MYIIRLNSRTETFLRTVLSKNVMNFGTKEEIFNNGLENIVLVELFQKKFNTLTPKKSIALSLAELFCLASYCDKMLPYLQDGELVSFCMGVKKKIEDMK